MLIHGTCVELNGAGILLRGPSGCGKSDLALRLIQECGFRLVADDQVALQSVDDTVAASPPPSLAGLLEVRGVGIVSFDHAGSTNLVFIADLCESSDVERMPVAETTEILSHSIPRFRVYPFEVSSTLKLRLMLAQTLERLV